MHRATLLLSLALLCAASLSHAAPPKKSPDKAPAVGLLKQADAIANQVANIRGLPLKGPIKKGVYNRAQLRASLLQKISEEYSDAEIENEALAFKRLGLLPASLNYKDTVLDLLTSQIAGFYDPDARELYIMKGLSSAMQRPTMAHEIFHGIQDQHFDLKRTQGPFNPKTFSDYQLARSSLIEGDATILMLDFSLYEAKTLPQPKTTSIIDMPMFSGLIRSTTLENLSNLEQFGGATDPALANVPPIIKDPLVFPYIGGLRFVVFARAGKTWAEFDKIYQNPPVSTEQIIHPEKYFSGDMPTILDFDASKALPGSTKVYDNVLGEYQLYVALKEYLRSPVHGPKVAFDNPSVATTGWDGDRLLTYKSKAGQVVTVHMSVWDSPKDAGEYHDALISGVTRRYKSPKTTKCAKATCLKTPDNKHVRIERAKDIVLYIDGADDPAALTRVRDAAMTTLKRVPFATERARQQVLFEAKLKKDAAKKKKGASPKKK